MRTHALRLLIIVMCSCWLAAPSRATVHNIMIDNFFFSPTGLHVNYGDTIQWTLVNGTHTTTSDASSRRSWDSGTLSLAGQTYQIVITPLDGPGPFPYHCTFHPTMVDTLYVNGPVPNGLVNPGSAAGLDHVNASIAIHERIPGEVYATFTEFLVIGSPVPTMIGWAWSPDGGAPGTWQSFSKLPDLGFSEEWNSWLTAMHPGFGGFVLVSSERMGPAWGPGMNAIVANITPGGGGGFSSPVSLMANTPVVTWVDYPVVEVDDSPNSPAFGDALFAWVEFNDATASDADGNGNAYDDAGDLYTIYTTSSAVGTGSAPLYPLTTGPFAHGGASPVYPGSIASHRPAVDITCCGNVLLPPGGAYVAWMDVVNGTIMIDASPTPGAGGPWGILTGGAGPLAVLGYLPVPPTINPGIAASNAVTIACDNAPNSPCPGAVYLAWTDMGLGDADIMFSSSFDGGRTWTPPVRANQDPIGNGLDQWAPYMRVDEYSGEIIIAYYDRRSDPANVAIEVWASHSADCGVTWEDCQLSDTGPLPPVTNTPLPSGLYLGDYLGTDQTYTQGPAFIWNDGRNGADQDIFSGSRTNCCEGVTGNINGSPGGVVDLSDLIFMVNYLFGGGPQPACPQTANVNGSGAVDLSDLIYLVSYLFSGGPSPAPCDPRC